MVLVNPINVFEKSIALMHGVERINLPLNWNAVQSD